MVGTQLDEPISGTAYYPTLSGKPGTTVFSNPPFHPNILNIGGGNRSVNPLMSNGQGYNSGGNLQRGKLVGGKGAYYGVGQTNTSYVVNFLYNPASISETRAFATGQAPLPAAYRNQGDPGQYVSAMNSAISFALLFDRTYEMWDRSYQGTLAGKYGVRVDIEALYNLTQINQLVPHTTNSITVGSPGNSTSTSNNVVVQGPMQMAPCNLYFGANAQGSLSYYGYISEMDITWTHFTAAMVPVRATVNLSFLPLPNTTSNYTIG